MRGKALAEVAEARSRTYWLLSELFLTAPEHAGLEALAVQLMACEAGAEERWTGLVADLRHALDDVSLDDLRREYTRLLGGIGPHYGPPPPYESVHRGEHQVAGEATARVGRAYAAAGFGAAHAESGPPDHLGVELRFMSLAAIAERDAWAAGDEGRALELLAHQAEFARDHLLAWVPGYCAVLREASRVPFYAALGALTERVVTDDRVLLIEFLARVADERSTGGTRRTGGKTSEHTI